MNEASPKDGKYQCGPLLSAKEMVTSLVTCIRAHRSFLSAIDLNRPATRWDKIPSTVESSIPDTSYLIPWRSDWNDLCEFKVFVHERRVTCFSQYVWSRDVGRNRANMKIVAPRIETNMLLGTTRW